MLAITKELGINNRHKIHLPIGKSPICDDDLFSLAINEPDMWGWLLNDDTIESLTNEEANEVAQEVAAGASQVDEQASAAVQQEQRQEVNNELNAFLQKSGVSNLTELGNKIDAMFNKGKELEQKFNQLRTAHTDITNQLQNARTLNITLNEQVKELQNENKLFKNNAGKLQQLESENLMLKNKIASFKMPKEQLNRPNSLFANQSATSGVQTAPDFTDKEINTLINSTKFFLKYVHNPDRISETRRYLNDVKKMLAKRNITARIEDSTSSNRKASLENIIDALNKARGNFNIF